MDEFKDTKCEKRNWKGMKKEFNAIINILDEKAHRSTTPSGKEQLISKASGSIRDAIKRQVSVAHFFQDNNDDDDNEVNAPLTNIGCEGVFSGFGNDCKRAGGSTSLKTISNESVVSNNKLFAKERWKTLKEKERRKKFRWARGSKEAKEVRRMEKEFRKNIEAVSEMAFESKREKKKKKHTKMLENLER